MKKFFVLVALVAMIFCVPMVFAADVIVEAEDFVKEEGGKVTVANDRVLANKASFFGWDNKGHAIEWEVDIPEDGSYKLVVRYCHNRNWNTLREIQIDGQVPHEAFKSVVFKSTGGWSKDRNDWQNFTVCDADGNPVMIQLTKGKHIVRMTNLGGDDGGSNGSINMDRFAFLAKDTDPGILGK